MMEIIIAAGIAMLLAAISIPVYRNYITSAQDAAAIEFIDEMSRELQTYAATHEPKNACDFDPMRGGLDSSAVEVRLDYAAIDDAAPDKGQRAVAVVTAIPGGDVQVARDIHDAVGSRVAPGAVLTNTVVSFSVYLTSDTDPLCLGSATIAAASAPAASPDPAPAPSPPGPAAPAPTPRAGWDPDSKAPPSVCPDGQTPSQVGCVDVQALTQVPDQSTCPPGEFFVELVDYQWPKADTAPDRPTMPPLGAQSKLTPGEPIKGYCLPRDEPVGLPGQWSWDHLDGSVDMKANPYRPVSCNTCVGPLVICETLYRPTTCEWPNNICGNEVINRIDGSRTVNRFCANLAWTHQQWWQGTSDEDKCGDLSQTNQKVAFQCQFACTSDNCNASVRPSDSSLWKPRTGMGY